MLFIVWSLLVYSARGNRNFKRELTGSPSCDNASLSWKTVLSYKTHRGRLVKVTVGSCLKSFFSPLPQFLCWWPLWACWSCIFFTPTAAPKKNKRSLRDLNLSLCLVTCFMWISRDSTTLFLMWEMFYKQLYFDCFKRFYYLFIFSGYIACMCKYFSTSKVTFNGISLLPASILSAIQKIWTSVYSLLWI